MKIGTIVLIGLMIFSVNSTSLAKDIVLKQFSTEKKKLIDVSITEFKKLRISKGCLVKGAPKCLAWDATSSKKKLNPPKIPLVGHPAARYCEGSGGVNLLFLDDKKNEIDYCVFKDKSSINSWDLYNAAQ